MITLIRKFNACLVLELAEVLLGVADLLGLVVDGLLLDVVHQEVLVILKTNDNVMQFSLSLLIFNRVS